VGAMAAGKAGTAPPTKQCPSIAPPPPRLPEAYYVNVTQTWGDPTYPDSGIVAVRAHCSPACLPDVPPNTVTVVDSRLALLTTY